MFNKSCQIEPFESRLLFDTAWGPTAMLVRQDASSSIFSSITGAGVTVAVIDSGINYNVPKLGSGFGKGFKVMGGYDFVENDNNPVDTDGHGTEVAGVIAADPFDYNGKHYSGIAPGANLVALRVTHGDDGAADPTIERALRWVIDHHEEYSIRVVNISLGSGNHAQDETNSTLSDEFEELAELNIPVIAASGNSSAAQAGIAYPAADPNVFAVGSVNSANSISSFAQRAKLLDLLAPGESVPTTARLGGYTSVSGTSFASPFAAGAAALVWQASGGVSNSSLLSILRTSGPSNFDGDTETGNITNRDYPRLDLYNALKLATARRTSNKNIVGIGSASSDIGYDQSGVLHLVYYDGAARTIRYATRDTDGLWSKTQIIDDSATDVGIYLAISIDQTGKPGIAYFDSTNADLKYAHFNGRSWDIAVIDSDKNVGAFPSIAYSDTDVPLIAYYRKSGADLKLASLASNGGWLRQTLDSDGNVGAWPSISVADGLGVYAVAYSDLTNGDLKYTRFADDAWTTFVVDDLGGTGYTSLNIHNGQAFISYQDLVNGDLKFAQRENSQWSTETIYTPGNTGQFTNLLFDLNDVAHVAFWSRSKNVLYQAAGTFGSWTVKKVFDGGALIAAAATENEDQLTVVALDITKRNLVFGNLV